MSNDTHKRLVIPGPVEVRREVLEAQTQWMIGHRGAAFSDLFGRLQSKLKQLFLTQSRVIVSGSSGTGLWEGASRCCIRDDRKALHLVGGAFSERLGASYPKQVDVLEVERGQAHARDGR
jgi:aspartate aminotransferase-like enzyme